MRVIKRNGAEVEFDIVKIIAAVTKANDVVDEEARMTPVQIQRIAESVEFSCQSLGPRAHGRGDPGLCRAPDHGARRVRGR